MRINALSLCLFAGLLLAGCANAPPVTQAPGMTFANLQPLMLDIASVEVRNDYKPPMREPNVEHIFPVPPYVAVETLVKKQLIATGNKTEKALRVVIDEASVVREDLPVTKGFWGAFAHEPVERLKAQVLLRVEMFSPEAPDITLGHAEVNAKRNKTLLEGTSVADRERAYFRLTEELMNDLNEGLRSVIKDTFAQKL